MYEKLNRCILSTDELIKELLGNKCFKQTVQSFQTQLGNSPIRFLITLDFINDCKIKEKTRNYINKLFENQEKYGYIYFLLKQKMLIPLIFNFQGAEILIDCNDKFQIMKDIEKIASEWACRDTLVFETTLLELYYFFTRLLNPELSWLAVESILLNVRSHTHLIMSPDRKYAFKEIEKPSADCK